MGQELKVIDHQSIVAYMDTRKQHIEQLIATSDMDAGRLIGMVVKNVIGNENLRTCTLLSIFQCTLQAAELGLEPGNVLQDSHLVPYGKQCKLLIGYRGMAKLARRAGGITSIAAYCVYKDDTFEVSLGTDPHIKHLPKFGERKAADIIAAYAVAKYPDGTSQFDVMDRVELDGIKARSQGGAKGPWFTDFGEMSKKTVLKRFCKYLPASSVELKKAIALDNAQETGRYGELQFDSAEANEGIQMLEPEPSEKGATGLLNKLKGTAAIDVETEPTPTVEEAAYRAINNKESEPPLTLVEECRLTATHQNFRVDPSVPADFRDRMSELLGRKVTIKDLTAEDYQAARAKMDAEGDSVLLDVPAGGGLGFGED